MQPTFRTRLFFTSVGIAVLALGVVGVLATWSLRAHWISSTERDLIGQASLAGRLLADHLGTSPSMARIDPLVDAIGSDLHARVTAIAPDGRVLGDSYESGAALAAMENHLQRPEVQAALARGSGGSVRFSHTIGIDMLYVAVPVKREGRLVGFVRLALPLTEVNRQAAALARTVVTALVAALVGALTLSFWLSRRVGRRVEAIAAAARRYEAGDFSRTPDLSGDDEIARVGRLLDRTARELARRLDEITRDHARTDAILGGMVEGVMAFDEAGRLLLANGAARSMLDLDDAAVGRAYVETIRHPAIVGALAAALRGERPAPVEVELARGGWRCYAAQTSPTYDQKGPWGAVLVLHDITDVRRTDQIRRDFVANVSHELRTPLTAIRATLEALIDGTVEDRDKAMRFLQIAHAQATSMQNVVGDLLRLSRIESGQDALELKLVSLTQCVSDVRHELADALARSRHQLTVNIPADADGVEADPVKLREIMRNLLANAVVYTLPGGRIHVTARRIGDRTEVTLSDTGVGIAAEDQPRIFERFYRVDKARSRESGGTGLGLAIVKHLVELHGGHITVESAPGAGSTFRFTLSRIQAPAVSS